MGFECPVPIQDYDTVTLAHGGGGKVTHRLIEQVLVPALDNPALRETLGEAARFESLPDRSLQLGESQLDVPLLE